MGKEKEKEKEISLQRPVLKKRKVGRPKKSEKIERPNTVEKAKRLPKPPVNICSGQVTTKEFNESVKRDEKGRFLPGHGPKTRGKVKGLTAYIRFLSNDYFDYVELLDGWARDRKNPLRERRECVKELLDRGVGRPTVNVNQFQDIHITIGLPDDIPEESLYMEYEED